jgi:hypothetical protein
MIEVSGNSIYLICLISIIGIAIYWYLAIRNTWSAVRKRVLQLEMQAPDNQSDPWILKAKKANKQFWIFVNPIGGDGRALSIYNQVLKPLLEKHEIAYSLFQTSFHGHPRQLASTIDPSKVAGIILVSGDGMVHECMNGYADKCNNDVQKLRTLYHLAPLALIPAGSSNGLSTSFGFHDVYLACKALLQGSPQPLDVQEIDFINNDSNAASSASSSGSSSSSSAAAASSSPSSSLIVSPKKIWDGHAFCFGIVADHDKLVESKLRGLGTVLKGNQIDSILVHFTYFCRQVGDIPSICP